MYKKLIMVRIVLCIVLFFAFVCVAEIFASPIQDEQAKSTEDESVTEMVEGAQSVSPDVVLEERREIESVVSAPAEEKTTIDTHEPDMFRRIVAIGDLPADYDPSLVLKKGRTITITSRYTINSEKSLIGMLSETIKDDIYDDSGQNLLIPKDIKFRCAYKISEDKGKVMITVTAFEMDMAPPKALRGLGGNNTIVMFLSPPIYNALYERMIQNFFDCNDEFLQQQEQLFISPAISAELIFGEESNNQASDNEKVAFSKNASGDWAININPEYEVDLQVKKDILFSAPFIIPR